MRGNPPARQRRAGWCRRRWPSLHVVGFAQLPRGLQLLYGGLRHRRRRVHAIRLIQGGQRDRRALHYLILIVLRVILKVLGFLRGRRSVQIRAVLGQLRDIVQRVLLRLSVVRLPRVRVVDLMELTVRDLHLPAVHHQSLLRERGVQVHRVHHVAHLQVAHATRCVGERVATDANTTYRHRRQILHRLENRVLGS